MLWRLEDSTNILEETGVSIFYTEDYSLLNDSVNNSNDGVIVNNGL
jgi:hypothetical protein